MPGDMGRWCRHINRVYNLSGVNMRNTDLLLFLIIGAGSNIAAVEGEVNRLDDTTGQFQCPCAYPFLRVPERDQRITSTCCQVFAAR